MSAIARDCLPTDVHQEMARKGYSRSVAVQARQTLAETEFLLQLASRFPFVAGVVGWVDLASADAEAQLERFAPNPKLVGIRHIAQSEPDPQFLIRPEFLRGVRTLQRFGLAYDILVFPRHLPVVLELVRALPQQKFVIDHWAKPLIKERLIEPWSSQMREIAKCENVYCKLSGLVTEADWGTWITDSFRPYADVVLEAFGPSRVMIGSDWPVCTVAGGYHEVMESYERLLSDLSRDEMQMVTGGTAAEFYGLSSA